ncbi:hypothetical protein [Candidatus Villigracilis affinis]|uniref:hypothetical protein n=1 Tax=Candidatus Villigracilis affinis TaxID=3140682 RepID=UPI002A1E5405|nr:hypothetical protein [Anaerolineales bacterium]
MKNSFVAVLLLILSSIACQTLFPDPQTTPETFLSTEPTQRITPSPILRSPDSTELE